MNKIQEEIIAEFDKILPECSCGGDYTPNHFVEGIFRDEVQSFLLQSLQKVEEAVREEIACKVEKIRFGFEPPYEGSEDKVMERYWKIQVETLNEVLDVINKK